MKLNTLLFLGTAAILLTGGGGYWYFSRENEEVKWRYGKVARGDIQERVSATGNLSAITLTPVGSFVSGQVTDIKADFNNIVKKGQVLATIDPQVYQQRLQEAKNNLDQRMTSLVDAENQLRRTKNLADEKLVSQQDLESKEVAYKNAKVSYDNAKINVDTAETNLGYCTIYSPVNGVVVSRKVDVGQTVQSSQSIAPLFEVAEDLSTLKLEISIDESDIAKVAVGQTANFTVDAVKEGQFVGTVSQVRLEPKTQQNVVNYVVVVEVQNKTKQQVEEEQQRQRDRLQNMMSAFGGGGRGPGQGEPAAAPVGGAASPEGQAAPADGRQRGDAKPGGEARQQGGDRPSGEARQQGGTRPGGEARQGGDRQGGEPRPGGGGRGMVMKADGTPDYDATWENMKERLLQDRPDLTKEVYIKEATERFQRMSQGGGQRMMGPGMQGGQRMPGGAPGQQQAQQQPTQQPVASGTAPASKIIKAGGQFYQDDYVLRPGMTAMVTIVTKQATNILYVQGIALRFDASQYVNSDAPEGQPGQQQGGQQRQQGASTQPWMRNVQQERRARMQDRGFASTSRQDNRIWVMDENGKPKRMPVTVGLNNGAMVEISGEGITEGMDILVGVDDAKTNKAGNAAASPFGGMGGGGMRMR